MEKGRFGIRLCVYPAVAFLLVLFNQWILCGLVFGAALLAEKNEWAGRQCLQAFFLALLSLAAGKLEAIYEAITDFALSIYYFSDSYSETIYDVLYGVDVFLQIAAGAARILVIIFAVKGFFSVLKGHEAGTMFSGFAYKAYGRLEPAPLPMPVPPLGGQGYPAYPAQPMQNQPPFAPPPVQQGMYNTGVPVPPQAQAPQGMPQPRPQGYGEAAAEISAEAPMANQDEINEK